MGKKDRKEASEDRAVTLFRDYLRLKTAPPAPEYKAAASFLKKLAKEVGLTFQVAFQFPE
jgi:aminoacylase